MLTTQTLTDLLYSIDSDIADIPFWQAAEEGQFLLHQCQVCKASYWPASLCTVHGGKDMAWVSASGRGEVHTFTIIRHAYSAAMKEKVPFNVSVIKLEEGPYFHSNVIDCNPEELKAGLKVEVVFQPASNGLNLPVFRERLQRR